jgi:hypothetical protein
MALAISSAVPRSFEVLDIVFVILGVAVVALMGVYALALRQL